MARKHEYIKRNLKVISKLVQCGDAKTSLFLDYKIYQTYLNYNDGDGKMMRYQNTAEDEKVTVSAVMRAVKNMESKM